MSKNDNWMPLFIGDYLADTAHLDNAQSGTYLHLLMHYWRNGPLPNDEALLAAIGKTQPKAWKAMRGIILAFFTLGEDGCLHQKRQDSERNRWSDISDKRREAGKRGAQSKWGSDPDRTPPNGHGNQDGKPDDKADGKRMANAKQKPSPNMANVTVLPSVCQRFARTPLPGEISPPKGGRDISPSTTTETDGKRMAFAIPTETENRAEPRSGLDGQRVPLPPEDQPVDPDYVRKMVAQTVAQLTGKPVYEIVDPPDASTELSQAKQYAELMGISLQEAEQHLRPTGTA